MGWPGKRRKRKQQQKRINSPLSLFSSCLSMTAWNELPEPLLEAIAFQTLETPRSPLGRPPLGFQKRVDRPPAATTTCHVC